MTRPALALLLLFAACSSGPPLPPDFRHSMGGPPMTAAAPLPDKPTVPADNPFHCPKATAP